MARAAAGRQLDLPFTSSRERAAFLRVYEEFEAAFDEADNKGGKESLHTIRSYASRLLEVIGNHARHDDFVKALKTLDPSRVFEILALIRQQMKAEKTNSEGGV